MEAGKSQNLKLKQSDEDEHADCLFQKPDPITELPKKNMCAYM